VIAGDRLRVGSPYGFYYASHPPGEVSRGETMLYTGTDPESYITEYALVYEETSWALSLPARLFL